MRKTVNHTENTLGIKSMSKDREPPPSLSENLNSQPERLYSYLTPITAPIDIGKYVAK